ncbi:MAG: peptidoglycan DD-metalloendopeptidase family protein [Candidatus Omnitrophica bacterium]|nr:peptidoglycan DD-metalloendopeptidase family protein [Candidatus Omnitrophota bacterium]MDE2222648.1 peptidoglycan DD-metalloendopeptidase family protein [Candidatus Omnitrophota bacterium]
MPTPISESAAPVPAAPTVQKQGVYHKVLAGQTLWQIAQEYGVNIQDIIDSNNIPNGSKLEVGQLVFIPGVSKVKHISSPIVDNNKSAFIWPVIGKVIVYFDDPIGTNAVSHGIDIQAQSGDDVHATREGTVILADYMSGYGDTVMIDHGDGFVSVYARNGKLLVRPGEHVYKGDVIARVGPLAGRTVEHFEIRRGSQATNPLYYLP